MSGHESGILLSPTGPQSTSIEQQLGGPGAFPHAPTVREGSSTLGILDTYRARTSAAHLLSCATEQPERRTMLLGGFTLYEHGDAGEYSVVLRTCWAHPFNTDADDDVDMNAGSDGAIYDIVEDNVYDPTAEWVDCDREGFMYADATQSLSSICSYLIAALQMIRISTISTTTSLRAPKSPQTTLTANHRRRRYNRATC